MEEGLHQPHRSESGGGAEEGESQPHPACWATPTPPLRVARLSLALTDNTGAFLPPAVTSKSCQKLGLVAQAYNPRSGSSARSRPAGQQSEFRASLGKLDDLRK